MQRSHLLADFKQRVDLFKMIWRHRKLAEKRNLSFQQNKAAKYVMWGMTIFGFVYLCFIAILMSLAVNDSRSYTPVEFVCGTIPFILVLDFFSRFAVQEIPAQLIKPYVLLPISKYSCIDNFIGTTLLSGYNFSWFAFLVPYILMSVVFCSGVWASLGILFFFWLLILVNTQWYHIARTLINDSALWWILVGMVYAIMAMPWYLGKHARLDYLFDFYTNIGRFITDGSPLPYLVPVALLTLLIFINRRIQYSHILSELMHLEKKNLHHVNKLSYFERFGQTGLYLQLEVKTLLRNKNPRKSFITSVSVVLMFSALLSFTDIYDSGAMVSFLGCYNFVVFGAVMLTRIMCNEGNYIDCLMVHQENILSLLKAKYLFYSAMLLVPFVLMIPTVIVGKWSLLMLLAYAVFTAGFQYFILFQMAVYNKQTFPLNTKYISKAGMENNYRQLAVTMGCLFVPSIIITTLSSFMSEQQVYASMLAVGVAFIATSKLWLRNIYNRMMRKKYQLLEGFQSSR
ncbi:DUF5687 family protein [Prevotella sp. SGI.027]